MTLFLLVLIAGAIYYFVIYKDSVNNQFFSIDKKRCPNCKNPVEESFNVCPVCKETLKRKCGNCGERLDVSWAFCPFCENPITLDKKK